MSNFNDRRAAFDKAHRRTGRVAVAVIAINALLSLGFLALVVWAIVRIVLAFT